MKHTLDAIDAVIQMEVPECVKKGAATIHFCHFEDRFQVLPANHSATPHTVFGCYETQKLVKGLTSKEWDKVLNKITVFYRSTGK